MSLSKSKSAERYSLKIQAMHWISAAIVIATVFLGYSASYHWFQEGNESGGKIFGLHVSLGLSVLLLTMIRVLIRLGSETPRIVGSRIQRLTASTVHTILYVLMVTMPVSAYMMYLAEGKGPKPFGFPLPTFGLRGSLNGELISDLLWSVHKYGGWLLTVLLVLHVLGALYRSLRSQSSNGVDGVARMWPARENGSPAKGLTRLPEKIDSH